MALHSPKMRLGIAALLVLLAVTFLGLLLSQDKSETAWTRSVPSPGEGIPNEADPQRKDLLDTDQQTVVADRETSSEPRSPETATAGEGENGVRPETPVDPKRIALAERLARILERFREQHRVTDARIMMHTYIAAQMYMQGKGEAVELGEDVPTIKYGRQGYIHAFPDGTIQVFYYSEYEFPEAEECVALESEVPRDLAERIEARAVKILQWIGDGN